MGYRSEQVVKRHIVRLEIAVMWTSHSLGRVRIYLPVSIC